MAKTKVLMADDEQDVVEVMAKHVSEAGYDSVIAFDGEDAWRKIQSELPDVVLLDINMPGMNGFEVLQALRQQNAIRKWIPVIIISARKELKDVQKGFDLDADHYITKPCTIQDVLKAVQLMVQLIPQHKSKNEA
ncbi:MAG TPA: response regulator [Candidatus Omnitrophota bacterium]|nr:response regulator [Candidatus Omnitrophota bacterium]